MFSRSIHISLLLILLSANTPHSHKNGDTSSIKPTHPQPINPSFSVILSVTGANSSRHSEDGEQPHSTTHLPLSSFTLVNERPTTIIGGGAR
ncbi:hypothetical protein Hanom_Chr06g00499631 [Helianthus anomalus]